MAPQRFPLAGNAHSERSICFGTATDAVSRLWIVSPSDRGLVLGLGRPLRPAGGLGRAAGFALSCSPEQVCQEQSRWAPSRAPLSHKRAHTYAAC